MRAESLATSCKVSDQWNMWSQGGQLAEDHRVVWCVKIHRGLVWEQTDDSDSDDEMSTTRLRA